MAITPLPQFEEELAELESERARAALSRVPESVVVRYGVMQMVGEFPYRGDERPGCGSKLVCKTHRGIELAEMLTSTCPNAGCSSSVTRQQMLDYIEASGGRQYPFSDDGRAMRVATPEDLARQAELDAGKEAMLAQARAIVKRLGLDMKLVEAEPLLGGERVTFYYTSEHRVDFRDLVQELRPVAGTRVELRQVGARDEARLVADYERCGQYCCCKTFLKVLKPVSMKSAKVQKATLDPLKISGRCGRLMCCLRYEDETYEDLKKKLPKRKTQVGTPEGDGIVVDAQILTQLVLVQLDADGRRVAVPVEELTEPGLTPVRKPEPVAPRERREPREKREPRPERRERGERAGEDDGIETDAGEATPRKRRRRRRRKGGPSEAGTGSGAGSGTGSGTGSGAGSSGGSPTGSAGESPPGDEIAPGEGPSGDGGGKKRRRRRRRRPGGGGGSGGGGSGEGGGGPAGE